MNALHSQMPFLRTRPTLSQSPLGPSSEGNLVGEPRRPENASDSSSSEGAWDGESRARQRRRVKHILCRRAAFSRLELIAQTDHRRSHLARRSVDMARSSTAPNETPRAFLNGDSESPSSETLLFPRITLSTNTTHPVTSSFSEGSRPKGPRLSRVQTSTSSSSQPLSAPPQPGQASPITLLSPKPIPTPGSAPSPTSGSLAQPDTHGEVITRLL